MSAFEPGLAGVALIAGATLAGAWLASYSSRVRALWPCAAAVLAAVVLADLLPDVWRELHGAGLGWLAAGAGGLAGGYAAAEALARRGCACQAAAARRATASGTATAAALAAHRLLEGAAVGLTGSPAVVAALVLHATGEGFALGALLRPEGRSRIRTVLVIACVSPLAGAAAFGQAGLPAKPSAVITAAIAGVLARTAAAVAKRSTVPEWSRRQVPAVKQPISGDTSGRYRSFEAASHRS